MARKSSRKTNQMAYNKPLVFNAPSKKTTKCVHDKPLYMTGASKKAKKPTYPPLTFGK